MRPTVFGVVLALSLSACESSSEPLGGFGGGGGGGGAISQGQASGNWSFTVNRTTTLPCTGGALANGQVLTAHIDVLADGGVSPATSNWQNPPTATVRPLSGLVRFTDGFSTLIFAASVGNPTSGMELRGTMTAAGSFTGTLTDPAPGFTPVFSTGGCAYATTGNKTG